MTSFIMITFMAKEGYRFPNVIFKSILYKIV